MSFPKKIFHGWYIVGVCFVISLLVGDHVTTLPLMLANAMTTAADAERFYWLIAPAGLLLLFMPLIIGRIVDRIGSRKPILVGCVLSGGGLILSAALSQAWQYLLVSALIMVGSMAATGIPVYALLLRWFRRNRGLAIALAMLGASIGQKTVISQIPYMDFMDFFDEANYGWWALLMFVVGAALLLITIPLILRLIRERPAEMGLCADGVETDEWESTEPTAHTFNEAFRTSTFWYIAGALFLVNILSNVPLTYMDTGTSLGHREIALSTGKFLAGFGFICMPFIGVVADRMGAGRTFAAIACVFAMCAGILVVMPMGWSAVSFPPLQAIFAVGAGVLAPIIIAECYGLSRFGIIYAVLTLIGGLGLPAGAALNALPLTFLKDGGFDAAMIFRLVLAAQIVLLLLSAYLIWKATRQHGKRGTNL